MEFWIDFNLTKPPVGIEVLAKCDEWIDEDFNKLGVRIGFLDEDDDGPFISAKWNNTQDYYETVTGTPTHWRYKDVEDSLNYREDIIKAEIEMCENSPVYFYNNYIRKPGEPKFTEEEYLHMVNMARNPLKFRNPEHVERPFIPDEYFAPPEPLVPKVGGNLYCNSGKRAPNSNIDVYVITKIGREYLYAEKPNLRRTVKMPIKSMAADMHNGTGYKQFFLSEQELLDHNEHSSLVSKLANNLSYLSLRKRTLKELREVANTLKL